MLYQRSSALFKEAQQVIPGGVNSPVRAFKGVGGDPVYFKQGNGAYLIDADNKQYIDISEELFAGIQNETPIYSAEIIDFITSNNNELYTISLGSHLPLFENKELKINTLNFVYEGAIISGKLPKTEILKIAYTYLNTPYLWGGKTAFGIDCSGFTQQVYRVCGYSIPRDAKDQAMLGDTLSFVEESTAGDLAFFDNEEGQIIHVGILLGNNRIIHAHGQVRIDMIDQTGIFNSEKGKHTHTLRVIKKII